jgi:hypothetical protein
VIRRRRRAAEVEPAARTLLVDHWYSHAVGHVIEALRRCQGYHACDPGLEIALVLNRASPTEVALCAPFVADVYGVAFTSFGAPVGSPGRALRRVPRDWDHVVHHHAVTEPEQLTAFEGLRRYYEAAERHFRARLSVGVAGAPPPPYAPHQQLRLVLPERDRERARLELAGRRAVALMPAGSGARYLYPSTASWLAILEALERRWPGMVVVLVGRLARGARTTSGITRGEVDRLACRPNAIDAFDRGILEQLALVEASSLFVSPHTGFGFGALAVDTPWLTLSGGDWHEYFFNGVPFHSVLPKSRETPAFARSGPLPMIDADADGEGPRAVAMGAARIRQDLDELVDAAVALMEGHVTYEAALADYFPRLLDAYGGDASLIHTFEDVHLGYL